MSTIGGGGQDGSKKENSKKESSKGGKPKSKQTPKSKQGPKSKTCSTASKPKSKSKPKSVVGSSVSAAPEASYNIDCPSGLVPVTTSLPQVDTVPPPPDERNAPMYSWMQIEDETLNVQEWTFKEQQYQILKNATMNEPQVEPRPDMEASTPLKASMEKLLAQLNSQLGEPLRGVTPSANTNKTTVTKDSRYSRGKDSKYVKPDGKHPKKSEGSGGKKGRTPKSKAYQRNKEKKTDKSKSKSKSASAKPKEPFDKSGKGDKSNAKH